jgi:hypothetical protein
MVAPAYASRRSEFAKQIGLGRGVRRASGAAATPSAGSGSGSGGGTARQGRK